MRRCHGCSGDGIDGVFAANPGRLDVEAGRKDVIALAVVGKVCALVKQSGRADSNGLLRCSWRVFAGVCVIVASSNREVKTSTHSTVDCGIKSRRLSSTKTHVGSGALEALFALPSLGSLNLLKVTFCGKFDTFDDIRHRARALRVENLHTIYMGFLGDAVLLTGNCSRTMSTVSVAVLVLIIWDDGLAPEGSALKVDMINIGTSIHDIYINTFTAFGRIEILVNSAEGQALSVRDTSETPWSCLLDFAWAIIFAAKGMNNGVSLDKFDLEAIDVSRYSLLGVESGEQTERFDDVI